MQWYFLAVGGTSVQLNWFGEIQLIVLYKGQAFKVLPPDTLEHR